MRKYVKIFCDMAVEYYFKGYSAHEAIAKVIKLLERGTRNE